MERAGIIRIAPTAIHVRVGKETRYRVGIHDQLGFSHGFMVHNTCTAPRAPTKLGVGLESRPRENRFGHVLGI